MKIILNQDIDSLGKIGEMMDVKDGYARNYLVPRGFAMPANAQNKAALDHQLRIIDRRKAKLLSEARTLATKIEKTSVTVTKQVGEDERIFGSVTSAELEELLSAEGLKVFKKDITIVDEIKKVGVYTAQVRLHPEIQAKFKVWVVAQ